MEIPRIEERTLYPPIISYLNDIGFKATGETNVAKKHPDILFQIDSISFVIEVKIGKLDVGLKAIAQATDYAKRLGTNNIIILIYPEKYKDQVILDAENVKKIALDEKVNALALTDYWTESLAIEPKKLFEQLKQQIILKKIKVDFKTVVELIEHYVRDLNDVVYQIKAEELITEVVNKLDLFSSIGEIKDKETAKKQVINLASYLLFNQLFFYHIYKRKSNSEILPELEEIKNVKDLQRYFDAITEIDYQSIYRVNILAHIPNDEKVINILNEVIKAIKSLRAEHITRDLAGRFFHDLIPYEVRKILAAFYTHPNAAEILAGLTIDTYDETVIDPACGSGTLLVAAYRRKQELYQNIKGDQNFKEMHKKFIENDLTGIDIMPFAAHMAAINLTMQNIEQKTNTIRIATLDSLELAESLRTAQFKRRGKEISPYTTTIQKTLAEIDKKVEKIKKKGAVSPEGKGSIFYIKPVDVVIMNPPFSDREKMPPEMREKLKQNPLGKLCGNQVNLWGYFLALADLLLKPGGKIGAVIPINIARGKATEKIRNFLLENYHIKYIVVPVADNAFSESAVFKDILLIAEKRKPKNTDITKIVLLKKSIKLLLSNDITEIISNIKKYSTHVSDLIEVISISSMKLIENKENLMPLLGFRSSKNMETLNGFFNKVKHNSKVTEVIKKIGILEGFHASPEGLSELVFITRNINKSRIKNAFLILSKEEKDNIVAEIKDTNIFIKIPKNVIKPALRTVTGINKIDITNINDFLIFNKFDKFEEILIISKWKNKNSFSFDIVKNKMKKRDWHIAIPSRFRLNSPNTSVIAVYSENKFFAPHTFKMLTIEDKEISKMYSIILNSILFILNFMFLRSQTTLGFTDLRESDLSMFKLIDVDRLSEQEKQTLLNLFEKLKDVEFPSILEQLENRFWARLELDKTILKILGFSDKEINEWLPKIYDALIDEIKNMG